MPDPAPDPRPAPAPKVARPAKEKRTADSFPATLAPKRYELESVRFSYLTTFLVALVASSTDDVGYGVKAEDCTEPEVVRARDAAILAAFAALTRIARDS